MSALWLYSQREGEIWDPVCSTRDHRPARFETRERASWFASRLCADLRIAIQVREPGGAILERWFWSEALGAVQGVIAP